MIGLTSSLNSSAAEADAEDYRGIAALNRCTTQKQAQRDFPQPEAVVPFPNSRLPVADSHRPLSPTSYPRCYNALFLVSH